MLKQGEVYQVKSVDPGEGWKDCDTTRAERILADAYVDLSLLADALRTRMGVRTMFSHWRIVGEGTQ